jgi:diadenosine tetraphosphate (Ap4A) HIT family hydrolase
MPEMPHAREPTQCPFDTPREANNEHWNFIEALSISSLYLSTNQTYRGYSLLVFDARHVERIDALSAAEWRAFAADLHVANRAISTVVQPDHMNVEQLGNAVAHLHWHIVPRYRTDPRWGGPIWTTSQTGMPMTRISENEQSTLVEKIRAALAAQ